MNHFKNLLITFLLLAIFIILSIHSYVQAVSNNLASSVLRLHIIANSDSTEDQQLKLKVRDNLLNYMNSICSNCSTKEDAMLILQSHISEFEEIANQTVLKNGYNYKIHVSIDKCLFPTKSYGDISFPAGSYDALKVQIGEGTGQNWWCVMFPPLCFVDVSSARLSEESKKSLKENLSDEDYSIITKSNDSSEFKFKIVEIFNKFKVGM